MKLKLNLLTNSIALNSLMLQTEAYNKFVCGTVLFTVEHLFWKVLDMKPVVSLSRFCLFVDVHPRQIFAPYVTHCLCVIIVFEVCMMKYINDRFNRLYCKLEFIYTLAPCTSMVVY